MKDVITIGSAIWDAFLRTPEAKVAPVGGIFTGEGLIFPYGAKCEVEELLFQSGGGGTNVAVGLARLGLKTAVLARCGRDESGGRIAGELRKEGVGLEFLQQKKGETTDYYTVLLGPDGGRTILVYRGGTKLEKEEIDWRRLKARWFYICSLEGNLSLLAEILARAQREKIKVAINPGRRELAQAQELKPLLAQAEVVILNREEAARLLSLTVTDERVFAGLAQLVKGMAVVTEGEKGATLFNHKEERFFAAGLKVKVKDATGAGDGFGAGLVGGLVLGFSEERALKLGVANGAAVVRAVGAKTGLMKKEDLAGF